MAKPEPLPQSVIIGCNTWNCASKISNANWETKLIEQVNVNQGDSIGVKASFIDTRGTASGNIVILKDTEISLEYYFYWIHNFNACDISGVTAGVPTPPDASNNLTQQVLVGRDILNQYYDSPGGGVINIPSYYTTTSGTGINDADGLPYIVYQSTPDFPVPPVVGPSEDALNIVVGQAYLVTTVGLTINWEYANVEGANYNQMPAGWNFTTDFFEADFNPWFNLATSAFIPAALAAPLPYITYVITNLGATDWVAIDPGLASNIIPATQMQNGNRYAIVTLGTLDYQFYGADENQVGITFTATVDPPALPPAFPQTITTAIFLANVSTWFTNAGGNTFGSDPADALNVVIDMNASTGALTLSSISGAGQWLSTSGGKVIGSWSIPGSYFGFNAGTPSASAFVTLTDFTATTSSLSVSNLSSGVSYTVLTTGALDGSDPQFTWNMVGTFPTAQSTAMTADATYQIIAPETGIYFKDCADGGRVSEIFTLQSEPNILSQVITLDTSTSPSIAICTLIDQNGFDYMPMLVSDYEAGIAIEVQYTNNIGVWYYFVYEGGAISSTLGSGDNAGSPFNSQAVDAEVLTLTIPAETIGTLNQVLFQSAWNPNPSVNGGFDYGNVWSMTALNPPPQPQQLIVFNGVGEVFTATAAYTGAGTTATVEGFTLTTATLTGTGYINGTVESSVVEVGTVVHAINPDPGLPTDNAGRANVSAYQAGSNIPFEYDGFVAPYTPPTTRIDVRPVKKKWKMNLKAGSYDPNNLAELITRNMTRQRVKRVNQVQGGPFGTQSTLTVPTDNIWNIGKDGSANEWASPLGPGQNTFYDSKNPNVYAYPSELDYNISPDQDDMPFIFVPAMNGSILNNNSIATDYIYAEIPHPNANGLNNLTSPNYYINLVPLISDVRSISPTIPSTVQADGYYSILPFYSQNGTTDTNGVITGNSGIFPIAFGATQTSLIYNNENDQLFGFNYLHSPMLAFLSTNTNDLTEVTAHMYTTAQKTTTMTATNFFTTLVDKNSGILLHKMEPQSFWNQLGFDIPALTTDLDNPNKVGFQMTLDEFNSKTTGGFCGASNIFNSTFHAVGSAIQPSVPDTELVFLTATPAAEQTSVIDALEPNLTIGKIYTIFNLGRFADFYGSYPRINWLEVGGLNPASTGQTFTATSTGFTPLPSGFNWATLPTVLEAGVAVATTTQLQNNYFEVQTTNSLNAVRIPTVRDQTGHFLIELVGYNSIYLDDKNKREIKSIVSSYFVSQGSFVAQVFPESYNYYHVGAPISLSNLKIRILDPYTGNEAIIGPNSSVYIQVNKMLSDIAIAQIAN